MTATGVSVRGADAVTLLLSAGTSYDPSPASPSYVREDPHARVTAAMDAAAGKSTGAAQRAHRRLPGALQPRRARHRSDPPDGADNTLRAGTTARAGTWRRCTSSTGATC